MPPSPFELPVTELHLDIHWRVPVGHPDPTVALARWLRFRLWRDLCEHAQRGMPSCAEEAQSAGHEPGCRRPQRCLAHQLLPLPGGARSHEAPLLWVHPLPGYRPEPSCCRINIKLLGRNAGPRWAGHVLKALQRLMDDTRAHEGGLLANKVEWLHEHSYTLQEAATRLSRACRWRVELLTSWSASAGDLGREDGATGHWLQQFPALVAQRAKKLVALDLADRQRAGMSSLHGDAAHQLGLRARDEGAWPALSQLRLLGAARLSIDPHERFSRSNAEAIWLRLLRGSFVIEAPDDAATSQALAPWLAMLEAIGGGGHTAEGHGAVWVVPLGGSAG